MFKAFKYNLASNMYKHLANNYLQSFLSYDDLVILYKVIYIYLIRLCFKKYIKVVYKLNNIHKQRKTSKLSDIVFTSLSELASNVN